MKKLLLILFIILFALEIYADFEDSERISVQSSISSKKISMDDTVTVEYVFKFMDNPAYWILDNFPNPTLRNLKYISSSSSVSTVSEHGCKTGHFNLKIIFIPIDKGKAKIENSLAHFVNIQDSIEIDVNLSGFDLEVTSSKKSHIPLIPLGLVLLGIALIIILFFVVKIQFKKYMEIPKPIKVETPEVKAIRVLECINPQRISAVKVLDEVSKCMRKYIELKYNIPATGMATDEILQTLSDQLIGQRFVVLRDSLKYCDDVRFAGKYPQKDEVELAIENAKIFVGG